MELLYSGAPSDTDRSSDVDQAPSTIQSSSRRRAAFLLGAGVGLATVVGVGVLALGERENDDSAAIVLPVDVGTSDGVQKTTLVLEGDSPNQADAGSSDG